MAGNLDFLLNLRANTTGFNKGVDGAKFAVNALVSAMAALGVGVSLKGLADTADQFTTLQARIKVAVGETGNFQEAMAGVYRVAIQTNSNLDSTASLFSQLNKIGKDMGLSQQQVLSVTKTINEAIKVGGGSAQATDAAITQLVQGLQLGILNGENLASVMEQAPAIADALAKSLGVTTGELRKMAENGELSAERVIKALQQQSGAIQEQYSKFPITISNALQRISTAWTMLIGEMDQASGASSSVAKILVYIADNLGELKRFVDDASEGVGFFVGKLQDIDPGTIDALKTALNSAYEAMKELAQMAVEGFEITLDVLDELLQGVFSFMTTSEQAAEGVSGFKKALDAINIVIGLLRDGFAAIGIAIQALTGLFYDMAGVWLTVRSKFSWGDAKQQFIADAAEMAEKAEQHYAKAQEKLMGFQSATLAAGYQAQKTQAQINQERIADNEKTLQQLQIDEQKALADQAVNNEKRKQLEVQLAEARKSANQVAINTLVAQISELDKSDDAFTKANIDRQAERLKAAQTYANEAVKANGNVLDAATHQHLLQMGYLSTQTDAQKKAGEVTVTALDDSAKSAEGFGLTASAAAERAAKALGVDLDVALNNVTRGMKEGVTQVQTIAAGFDDLKKKGTDASALLVAGIDELIKKAKNQADLDALRNLINQLGAEGKLSVDQVAVALGDVGKAAKKVPEDIDTARGALEALGVDVGKFSSKTTEEFNKAKTSVLNVAEGFSQLKADGIDASGALAASLQELLKDAKNQAEIEEVRKLYIQFGNDGKLSALQVAEGLRQANEELNKADPNASALEQALKRLGVESRKNLEIRAQQLEQDLLAAKISGQLTDQQLKQAEETVAKARAAADGVEYHNNRVSQSYNRVSDAATGAGNAGVRAAQTTAEAWDNTVTSISKAAAKLDEITRKQGSMTGSDFLNGNGNLNKSLNDAGLLSYSEEQIKQKLISEKGYDADRASREAKRIFSDQSWARGGVSIANGQLGMSQSGDLTNYNYINSLFDRMNSVISSTTSSNQPEKTVNVNLQLDGKTVPARVPASQEQNFLDMLKQAKKVS
ncbi:tape measure protein [Alkanindiges illinoisensis]|uniref:tape measure protein n=1 Tax=Alkanindiges illinoisensis TaxID=197183 RepID=UPI000687F3CB|nr:tape measure protein [Alkanindiges illinoisensis]